MCVCCTNWCWYRQLGDLISLVTGFVLKLLLRMLWEGISPVVGSSVKVFLFGSAAVLIHIVLVSWHHVSCKGSMSTWDHASAAEAYPSTGSCREVHNPVHGSGESALVHCGDLSSRPTGEPSLAEKVCEPAHLWSVMQLFVAVLDS